MPEPLTMIWIIVAAILFCIAFATAGSRKP
jgi:hypothetical protein